MSTHILHTDTLNINNHIYLNIYVLKRQGRRETDKTKLKVFIENHLPSLDIRFLRKIYAQMNPSVKTTFTFECSKCEYTNHIEMPMTTDFFWPTVK